MPIGYPTPSQVGIYIGPYHVDDVYSIEYDFRDSRTPLYNYFNDIAVGSSSGKKIVVGVLAINFRYPGYLTYAIEQERKKSIDIDKISEISRDGETFVSNYVREMRTASADERIRLMLQAANIGAIALQKMSALSYLSQFGGQGFSLESGNKVGYDSVFDAQNITGNQIKPVDIWVHYGDIDSDHIAEVLEDVVFTGERKQIQAGATSAGGLSSSGQNILEVYSFWAKKKSQYSIDAEGLARANDVGD